MWFNSCHPLLDSSRSGRMLLLLAGWALAFQAVQLLLQLFPILLVLFRVDGIIQVCVKFQHILPQSSQHWVGVFMREVMHEASIRFVCQDVLARKGFASRVKVAVKIGRASCRKESKFRGTTE